VLRIISTLKRVCNRLGYRVSNGRKDDSSVLRYSFQVDGRSITKLGVREESTRQPDSCINSWRYFPTKEFSGRVSSEPMFHFASVLSQVINASAQNRSYPGAVMKSRASESPDPAPTNRNDARGRPRKVWCSTYRGAMPTVLPSASEKIRLCSFLPAPKACHQAASHSGVWKIETREFSASKRFQESRNWSSSSQTPHIRNGGPLGLSTVSWFSIISSWKIMFSKPYTDWLQLSCHCRTNHVNVNYCK
jgi:hypothetical protein